MPAPGIERRPSPEFHRHPRLRADDAGGALSCGEDRRRAPCLLPFRDANSYMLGMATDDTTPENTPNQNS